MDYKLCLLAVLVSIVAADHDFDPELESYVGRALLESQMRIKEEETRLAGYNTEPSNPFLAGDLLLPSQGIANALENSMKKRKKRTMFNFQSSPDNQWQLPIEYTVSSAFTPAQAQNIRDNIALYERETCITFVSRTESDPALGNNPYIGFTKGTGCISFVSKGENDRPQKIFLSDSCFVNSAGNGRGGGEVARTIGMALGLWHETMRPDRDEHVTIQTDNAQPEEVGNFLKLDEKYVETYGHPYDYGSLMHFAASAFASSPGTFTVQPTQAHHEQTIGQRVAPSFWDIGKINRAYCSNVCTSTISCQNMGYQDPADCSRCRCPDGYGGQYCEQTASSVGGSTCGGEIQLQARQSPTVITSPGYPGDYGLYKECNWKLNAPVGKRIRVWFDPEFDVYCRRGVAYHWVEVRVGSDLIKTGPRFCGDTRPLVDLISDRNQVMVLFRSNYDNNNQLDTPNTPGSRSGFKLYAEVLNCGGCGMEVGETHMPCESRIETQTVSTQCCGYRQQTVCHGWWIFRHCRRTNVPFYYPCEQEQPVKFCCDDDAQLCGNGSRARCTRPGWGEWSNCRRSCRRCSSSQWRCYYDYGGQCSAQQRHGSYETRPCQ